MSLSEKYVFNQNSFSKRSHFKCDCMKMLVSSSGSWPFDMLDKLSDSHSHTLANLLCIFLRESANCHGLSARAPLKIGAEKCMSFATLCHCS